MSVQIGSLPEERVGDAFRVFATALHLQTLDEQRLERRRPSWFLDRALVAYDGKRIVGHAGDFPFETLLPGGGYVATAGLTRVGVLPSHRRRGALTAMMQQHLRQARERGEVLGSLRAAEAAIYGRFGYGLAGLAASVRVMAHRGGFARPLAMPGRFEVSQGTGLLAAAKVAYERCLTRPGMLRRPDWYWAINYVPHLVEHPSVSEWGVIHYDIKGRPDGFAKWETVDREHWDSSGERVAVTDLFGASFEVEAAMWRFVLDLDLVEIVTAPCRPIDDPVRHRFANARAFESTEIWDEQWVRLLDVAAVLGARRYATDDSLVVEVAADPVFADNVGRYEVGNERCRRVRRAPDLSLPVDVLGAVVLGGTSFSELAAAGRLLELRKGAVARADRMFHTPLAPWCGTFF